MSDEIVLFDLGITRNQEIEAGISITIDNIQLNITQIIDNIQLNITQIIDMGVEL